MDEEGFLYHGTIHNLLAGILEKGVLAPSCWGSLRVAEYYAQDGAETLGYGPVLIRKSLGSFESSLLEVDQNSVAEPLTYTLKAQEEELWAEFEASNGSWQACLEIYESVRYSGVVAVDKAEVIHMGGEMPLPRAVFCKVLAKAVNGEPKVVELDGGWKLTRVGLVVPEGNRLVHCEEWGAVSLGVKEWGQRGFRQEQIEAAWLYVQGLASEAVEDPGMA